MCVCQDFCCVRRNSRIGFQRSRLIPKCLEVCPAAVKQFSSPSQGRSARLWSTAPDHREMLCFHLTRFLKNQKLPLVFVVSGLDAN